jgi:Tfp pilus assembly PilM family ATPase/F0F1-type ATP synthase membrane subunit b/b'
MVRNILALDINDTVLRFVLLEKNGNVWHVGRSGVVDGSVDIKREGALSEAINSILNQETILPRRLFLSLSRKDVFVHQFVIPKMSERQTRDVVMSEIEKNMEFTSQAFDFTYQLSPFKKGQSRVLFAAVPQNLLNRILEEISRTKLNCQDLEISPLNARALIPTVSSNQSTEAVSESSSKGMEAMVVLYERHAHFAVFDKDQYQIFYKLSLGMNDLISDSGLKAESVGMFVNHLKRMIKTFSSEHRGQPITSIWLIWDSTKIADFDKILENEIAIKTRALDLDCVKDVITVTNSNKLNPIDLLAVSPVVCFLKGKKPFFTTRYFLRTLLSAQRIYWQILVAVIVLSILGLGMTGVALRIEQKKNFIAEESRKISQEITQVKRRRDEAAVLRANLMESRNRLFQQASYVRELNRVSWSQVLSIVANEMPEDLALTSFTFREAGEATIKGEARQMEVISELIRKIELSSILEKGTFNSLQERETMVKGNIDSVKFYQFGISARLRSKIEGDQ